MRCLIVLLVFAQLFATTIHIPTSAGAIGLQNAITHARANDTISLGNGIFFAGDLGENGIFVGNSIFVKCEIAMSCTISALSSTRDDTAKCAALFYASAESSVFANFTGIVFAHARNESGSGGGVMCVNVHCVFDSCAFAHNRADSVGGGALIFGASATFLHCLFLNNRALHGGGMLCTNCDASFLDCTFEDNFAETGGGLLVADGHVEIIASSFVLNEAHDGAGFFLTGSTTHATVENCSIAENFAYNGAGFFCASDASANISSCDIRDNRAYEGGGCFIDSSAIVLHRNIFENNTAVGYGCAFFISHTSDAQITENYIAHNISVGDAGGVFVYFSEVVFSRNYYFENGANGYGGAFYVYGGSSVDVHEDVFHSNSSGYGAAIYVEFQCTVFCTGCTFAANIARMGGAISVVELSSATVESCVFVDNGSWENAVSGIASILENSEHFSISHSNLYSNTLQRDIEITDGLASMRTFENNFLWGASPDSVYRGHGIFTHVATDFITNVPGEPQSFNTLIIMDFHTHTFVTNISELPETLLIRLFANSRNSELFDVATVIVRSRANALGIGVALVETAPNSGVYEGKIAVRASTIDTVRLDDVRQIVKVEASGDLIKCYAAADTTCYTNISVLPVAAIAHANTATTCETRIKLTPNPFNSLVNIELSTDYSIEITDISGKLIEKLPRGAKTWAPAPNMPSGVYFLRGRNAEEVLTTKAIFLR